MEEDDTEAAVPNTKTRLSAASFRGGSSSGEPVAHQEKQQTSSKPRWFTENPPVPEDRKNPQSLQTLRAIRQMPLESP